MSTQTKTYEIQVANDIVLDYDFVTSAYYTDSGSIIRARVLVEMSSYFEGLLQRNHKVVSFVEVVAQVATA